MIKFVIIIQDEETKTTASGRYTFLGTVTDGEKQVANEFAAAVEKVIQKMASEPGGGAIFLDLSNKIHSKPNNT